MSTFVAQQVMRSHAIHLPAALHHVLPLFEPLGEKHWVHGWNPEMIYPPSGIAQEGTIFTTRHADEPARIWIILTFEKEQAHIRYLNVLPHSHTSMIDVCCESDGTEATVAHITYTLTALTPQGNIYLDGFTQEYYQAWISSWETAITHYLLHGHMLSHEEG